MIIQDFAHQKPAAVPSHIAAGMSAAHNATARISPSLVARSFQAMGRHRERRGALATGETRARRRAGRRGAVDTE